MVKSCFWQIVFFGVTLFILTFIVVVAFLDSLLSAVERLRGKPTPPKESVRG